MDQGSRPTPRDSLRSVLVTFAVAWLWVSATVVFISGVLGTRASAVVVGLLSVTPDWLSSLPGIGPLMSAHPGFTLFTALVFAPIFEEALFRVLPLSYALVREASLIEAGHKERGRHFVRAVAVVVCGIVFGLVHGSPLNIFVQGAVGLLSAKLYLQNYQHSQRRAYLMCVALHFTYNFAVLSAGYFT